jgi:hypothetical protein
LNFRIPDFPLGALFAALMASIAILFAFPDLAGDWLWWALVFAAFILWSLGAGILDKVPLLADGEPEHPENCESGQQDKNQQGISADASALIDAITRQERTNRTQEKSKDDTRRRRELITILIISVTACAIILQVNEMKRVYGPIHDQADAARKQAQAALDQASAARIQADAAAIGNSAWIAPLRFSLPNLSDPQEPLKVRIWYQNVGREPAKNLRNSWNLHYIRTPSLPPEKWGNLAIWNDTAMFDPHNLCRGIEDITLSGVAYPSSSTLLAIDASRNDDANYPASMIPVLFDEVKARATILFVVGCFAYDSLGRTRHSSYCAFLNPSMGGKDISEWNFTFCPHGNDDY